MAVCGCGGREPPSDTELADIHRHERIARLESLAGLNDRDGAHAVARKLRELRAQLIGGEVTIPPDVNHGDLEGWAMGSKPKRW